MYQKSGDLEKNIIKFYDKNKETISCFDFEVIGVFNNNSSIWTWGWAIPTFNKNITYKIRKLLNYGIDLDAENILLKTELITSKFIINDPIQLDIHVALASFIAKNPVIYPLVINNDITYPETDFLYPIEKKQLKNYDIHYLFILQ